MVEELKKHSTLTKKSGPIVLAIMDGVGYGKYVEGDAVKASKLPTLDSLTASCPHVALKAHGTAVGLPSDDDMGNSEVGHNALGCGRVFSQGAKLVSNSIATGHLYQGETWLKLTNRVKENDSTLHFIGLLSDGNVHSHIDHLEHMVRTAKQQGVKTVRIHALLDGRDVGATSALDYFEPFEAFLKEISDENFDGKIASGGGRMVITMDRYDANWDMVRLGWETHVLGVGQIFPSAVEAIHMLREETKAIDQDIPPFVVADEDGAPVGTIEDGDSVIFFNFRGDRSLEITKAFEQGDSFDKFDRVRVPDVEYAGMMEYDGDLHIPSQFLVNPPQITRTMSEYLAFNKVRQYAISETQKFGHVTYFFNGNNSGKFDNELETFEEVLSDVIPFEKKPEMKCKEITDKVVAAIESGKYDFIRLNYPNGDMVGHTGVFEAVKISMEAMDTQIARLKESVEKVGGVLMLTADHGNADDMYEHKKTGEVAMDGDHPKAKTSHSLNPVPFIIFDPTYNGEYKKELNEGLGISSVTATCMNFLGFEAPEDYDSSILKI
ncbi:MAG: 2,3-bisphosphoglycerate-independent phosphoglycerate mutase [Spirochaetales bacterium]|nr:2,3-bisphosphoglycerate-independent phosphoglycerate mutase [Spirochaetales bacterium]